MLTGGSTTLWIDKATFLIRRIDRSTQFPTFHTVQTITYRPSINVEIPDSALAFNYPKY
jgi:outer membrane lipoprotein-sorting protein